MVYVTSIVNHTPKYYYTFDTFLYYIKSAGLKDSRQQWFLELMLQEKQHYLENIQVSSMTNLSSLIVL